MRSISFAIHFVGSSDELFARNVLIGKPKISIVFYFNEEDMEVLGIEYVSHLISEVKAANRCVAELIGEDGMESFSLQATYIKQSDYLLALEKDKLLDEIFSDFQTDHLQFYHFYVSGGASFESNGYRFVVHSDEAIHKNMPHVHIVKNDESVRYSLVTLERIDNCSREFLRDEKKKILPALKKYLPRLEKYWTLSMNGYRPPEFDFRGKQYYSGS